jgi:Matrixin
LLIGAAIYFYQVALHELGHSLGIAHSSNPSAVMAPYYQYNPNIQLTYDDIQAIQALYGGKCAVTEARISCEVAFSMHRSTHIDVRLRTSMQPNPTHS